MEWNDGTGGTLFAALVYFRADFCRMLGGLRSYGRNNENGGGQQGRRLLLAIVVASVPVIIAGLVLHVTGTEWTRSLYLLSWCTLIFGIVLWIADRFKPADRALEQITVRQAFFIGLVF